MYVKLPIRNFEKVQEYLGKVPRGAVKAAIAALGEYFLGNDAHGLKHYEPYKYVSRKRAYGQTFQSEKQRRWFWANGGPDMIGNNRSGETANAWTAKSTNSGYGLTLENKAEGAKWIWGDRTQAAQPALVGHRTATEKVMSNMKGAIRHAVAAVNKFMGKKG
jgi:hypothetical protein